MVLVARPETLQSVHKGEVGGLSGAPLKEMSTKMVEDMYKLTKGGACTRFIFDWLYTDVGSRRLLAIPIIGAGGISSGRDAYEKITHGASLVQLYSALAYEGPALVPRIKDELAGAFFSFGLLLSCADPSSPCRSHPSRERVQVDLGGGRIRRSQVGNHIIHLKYTVSHYQCTIILIRRLYLRTARTFGADSVSS